jgi:hypothetical protein
LVVTEPSCDQFLFAIALIAEARRSSLALLSTVETCFNHGWSWGQVDGKH